MAALRSLPFFLAALVVVSCLADGQQSQLPPGEFTYIVSDYHPEVTFSSKAILVQTEAVVRDGALAAVDGLGPDDFEINADGVPQHISGFDVQRNPPRVGANAKAGPGPVPVRPAVAPPRASSKPRYVLFFVDDVGTGEFGIGNMRRGALGYLKSGLAPNEWMAVATSSEVTMQDFTQNRGLIEAALNHIMPRPRTGCNATASYRAFEAVNLTGGVPDVRAPAPAVGYVNAPQPGGAVVALECTGVATVKLAAGEIDARATYDAMQAQMRYLAQKPGDRVFLLASYGIFSEDDAVFGEQTERIVNVALQSHITINSLDTQGAGELLAGTPDLTLMANVSEDTGGRIFYGDNGFAEGVRELVEPPEVSYLLGFTPQPPHMDGQRHEMTVKLTHQVKGRVVSARTAYIAPETEPAATIALRKAISEAVLVKSADTGLLAGALVATRAGAGAAVEIQLQTPGLPFAVAKDHLHTNTVLAVAELFDTNGKSVAGEIGQLDLKLNDASLAAFEKPKNTVALKLTVRAPAGKYRLRTVVGEAHTGLISAANTDVVVPQ